VLLPPSGLAFLAFLGSFLVAILLGMVSHVPGGVGVFEGLMVLLLKPDLSSGQLLPALVVYRAV
jgi:phosphatidylglycerol lysyltransferase